MVCFGNAQSTVTQSNQLKEKELRISMEQEEGEWDLTEFRTPVEPGVSF